jgi:hypothetical protein
LIGGLRGGSLAQRTAFPLVASFSPQPASSELLQETSPTPKPQWAGQGLRRRRTKPNPSRALTLIQGSFSGRKVERRSPWLAGFHRAADGTLAGLGFCMLALSGLTLHWQNQWGHQYEQLEISQSLGQRLQESAAVLEQHHLGAVKRPGLLVPTNSENLIYLGAPKRSPQAQAVALLSSIQLAPIRSGY